MSEEELKKVTKNDVVRFTLKGLKTKVKAVKINDGDSCHLAFYRNDELVRFRCRLVDVDAPELDKPNGEIVRDFFAWVCMGKDPDEFDDTTTREKEGLQNELDNSENLLYAVFEDFYDDPRGRVPVTLRTSPTGKYINKMVRDYVEGLELDY